MGFPNSSEKAHLLFGNYFDNTCEFLCMLEKVL